ncbi:hypothetical protein BP5796_11865 [Coleophoma crateriformis]|uniref:Mid2 domain-containing protein n=1 Tax=Coleophoma crateriformis TaxID=565419 RepID=A0A3D8QEK9_9HELO|nr:hypothetical protein BP5796_11865 [Coleophoma crateriformis]
MTTTHPPETNSGVVTSWLPVTTAWPSVSQCSSEIYSQIPFGTNGGALAIAFDPYYAQSIDSRITCLPPAATLWWDQTQQIPAQTVTSLGPFVCPGLYTTASTSNVNGLSTFIACCPSSYTFQSVLSSGLGQCNSELSASQLFTYASFDLSATEWTIATTTISSQASVFAVHVNGYAFAASTVSSTSSTSGSQTTAAYSQATLSSTIASTSSPSSTFDTSDHTSVQASGALSTGAKAGIGIGISLVIIGLSCVVAAFLFKRRRQRKLNNSVRLDIGYIPPYPSSLSSSAATSWQEPPIMPKVWGDRVVSVHELSSTPRAGSFH